MQQARLGGTAMIAGALMLIVTMAFHPTGHEVAADVERQGALSLAVHSLALLSLPIAFYGALALTRRLSPASALAELALVFQGMASVAGMLAATASGLIAPGLIARMLTQEGAARAATDAVLEFNGSLNQAFAKILVVASSVAIGLWSVAILRTRLLGRGSGVLGCALALVTVGFLLGGHLRLDVHGFGAVVLGQTVWLVLVGLELRRPQAAAQA